jgi:hypothetical protein
VTARITSIDAARAVRRPGRTLELRWYEDALALASYLEGRGEPGLAEVQRRIARRIQPRPAPSAAVRRAA